MNVMTVSVAPGAVAVIVETSVVVPNEVTVTVPGVETVVTVTVLDVVTVVVAMQMMRVPGPMPYAGGTIV